MREAHANPEGRPLHGQQAAENGVASDHFFSILVERRGGRRSTYMDGDLARRSPLFGVDGVRCRGSNKKRVYVGEVVIAELSDANAASRGNRPRRILAIYWDEASEKMMMTVRCFRFSEEVVGGLPGKPQKRSGVTRVWEERGGAKECTVQPSTLIDACEVLDPVELSEEKQE